jgi:hypothetical protein
VGSITTGGAGSDAADTHNAAVHYRCSDRLLKICFIFYSSPLYLAINS